MLVSNTNAEMFSDLWSCEIADIFHTMYFAVDFGTIFILTLPLDNNQSNKILSERHHY